MTGSHVLWTNFVRKASGTVREGGEGGRTPCCDCGLTGAFDCEPQPGRHRPFRFSPFPVLERGACPLVVVVRCEKMVHLL
jgi:hypothetical protein